MKSRSGHNWFAAIVAMKGANLFNVKSPFLIVVRKKQIKIVLRHFQLQNFQHTTPAVSIRKWLRFCIFTVTINQSLIATRVLVVKKWFVFFFGRIWSENNVFPNFSISFRKKCKCRKKIELQKFAMDFTFLKKC